MKKLPLLTALLFTLLTCGALGGDSGYDDSANRSSGGTVYKTVGPDGEVVFTDKPQLGSNSERVELGPINVQPIALPKPLPTRKLSPKDQRDPDDRYVGPINFAIVSPESGATIPPGQRLVVLQVAIDPLPPQGHRFYAIVDGQRWRGGSSGNSLDISSLDRGSHSVQAVLTDPAGNLLARSQTIMLYVKRPGDQVPEYGTPQATQAPKTPASPGLTAPQQRRN